MRQRTVRDWKPRPFSDLYRPLEEKRKLLLENYRARGPADQGLREIFPGCFLDAALSLLDTCVPYFPAALLSIFNRLLRQRVGGHSWETFGMEMKNLIIQCVFNEGPPQDTAVNKIIPVLQESLVWWGEQKTPQAKPCNKSYDRVPARHYGNSESDHVRLLGGEYI